MSFQFLPYGASHSVAADLVEILVFMDLLRSGPMSLDSNSSPVGPNAWSSSTPCEAELVLRRRLDTVRSASDETILDGRW